MWLERFVIIVTSLHRDFLPSSWGMYYRHDLGLGGVPRHDRPLPHAALPLHPLPAGDLDLRDAHASCPRPRARSRSHEGAASGHADIYGLMAEFDTPARRGGGGATRARRRATARWTPTRRSRSRSWREALGFHHSRAAAARAGRAASSGCVARLRPRSTGASVIDYPMNVGGRPLHSWPAFISRAFETTILFAALAARARHAGAERPAEPYHPVFNVPALRARHARPLLPLHRGARPASSTASETRRVPREPAARDEVSEVEH